MQTKKRPLPRIHVAEAARMLDCTPQWIGRLIKAGKLTVIKRETRRTWLATGEVEAFRESGADGAEWFREANRDYYPRKGARLK